MSPETPSTYEAQQAFLEEARARLERYYISPRDIAKLINAGMEVSGVRYFRVLNNETPEQFPTLEAALVGRLEDTYIGATVYDEADVAAKALEHLRISGLISEESLAQQMRERINHTIRLEGGVNTLYSAQRMEKLSQIKKQFSEKRLRSHSDATILAFSNPNKAS